jgi:hypothetical protein
MNFLENDGYGSFYKTEETSRLIREKLKAKMEQEARFSEGHARIIRIIEQLPVDERSGFSISKWLEEPITAIGQKFGDLATSGGSAWYSFERNLRDIEYMFHGGNVPTEFLSLPLTKAAQRFQKALNQKREEEERRKRESEAKAAIARAAFIEQHAIELLGYDEAQSWISRSPDKESQSHLERCHVSQQGLEAALSALGAYGLKREKEAARNAEIAVLRAQLSKEARTRLGEQRAKLFLNTTHTQINARPWDYCTNQQALQTCLNLLKGAKRPRWY